MSEQHLQDQDAEFPVLDEEQISDRRRFMQRTLSLTATLAAAGISEAMLEAALFNDAEAADLSRTTSKTQIQSQTQAQFGTGRGAKSDFANALSMAARDGNNTKALQQFGGKLNKQQAQVLEQLSSRDLNTLMSLKRKIDGGSAKCCDAGATIF